MQNTHGNSSRKILCTYLMSIKINARNIRWISVVHRDWHNWPQRKQYEYFRVATLWGLFTPVKRTEKKKNLSYHSSLICVFGINFFSLQIYRNCLGPKVTNGKRKKKKTVLFELNSLHNLLAFSCQFPKFFVMFVSINTNQ